MTGETNQPTGDQEVQAGENQKEVGCRLTNLSRTDWCAG